MHVLVLLIVMTSWLKLSLCIAAEGLTVETVKRCMNVCVNSECYDLIELNDYKEVCQC